eukprot:6322644-Amphidinium_carterae.2
MDVTHCPECSAQLPHGCNQLVHEVIAGYATTRPGAEARRHHTVKNAVVANDFVFPPKLSWNPWKCCT